MLVVSSYQFIMYNRSKHSRNVIVEFNLSHFWNQIIALSKNKRRNNGVGLKITDIFFIKEHLSQTNKILFNKNVQK